MIIVLHCSSLFQLFYISIVLVKLKLSNSCQCAHVIVRADAGSTSKSAYPTHLTERTPTVHSHFKQKHICTWFEFYTFIYLLAHLNQILCASMRHESENLGQGVGHYLTQPDEAERDYTYFLRKNVRVKHELFACNRGETLATF